MTTRFRPLKRCAAVIDATNEGLGRAIAWLVLVMVIVTFGVVVARYGFNEGSIAVQESVMYFHSLVFLGAAGYTLKHDGHVRIDVFYNRISVRGQALVNLFGAVFLLLPVFGYILWESWEYVMRSWALREGSQETGGLPLVYVLKTFIPLLSMVMILQGLAEIIHNLMILLGEEKPAERARPAESESAEII